ncbi:hypothetical protein BC829DRAFT_404340 [Chytridium lagenaria]|nr:hypothetical protein BC829DRAFT_404340 [Chytridium lagenaria]
MHHLTTTTLLLLTSLSSTLAAVATNDGAFTFTGAIMNNMVQITVKGAVPADGYIALGVPRQDARYIAYPVNTGAAVIEGAGANQGSKTFAASSTPPSPCLRQRHPHRRLHPSFNRPNGVAIVDGPLSFLWATGKMSATGTSPTKHTSKGVISGNLIGAAVGGATTTAAGGSSNPYGAAEKGIAGAVAAAAAGVAVAALFA